MDIILAGVFALAILFFILAILCEIMDSIKFTSHPATYSLKDESDKQKNSEFYSCFSCTYMVTWRSAYIISFISSTVILYILNLIGVEVNIGLFLALLAIIFAVNYLYSEFKRYHLYQVMCDRSKFTKPTYNIM